MLFFSKDYKHVFDGLVIKNGAESVKLVF